MDSVARVLGGWGRLWREGVEEVKVRIVAVAHIAAESRRNRMIGVGDFAEGAMLQRGEVQEVDERVVKDGSVATLTIKQVKLIGPFLHPRDIQSPAFDLTSKVG